MIPARTSTPIASTDRVSDVLARDEALVEIFVRRSAHFEKLRNVAMRRVMARLVTVAQAARIAGVGVDVLVRDLNEALQLDAGHAAAIEVVEEHVGHRPAALREVELDVREDMRTGREPFSRIMAAVAKLGADEVLHLHTIFEPVPLFELLERRNFSHEASRHSAHDWSIWFWRTGRELPEPLHSEVPVRAGTHDADSATVWLDVRGLEPPEPLVRTLAALEELPDGHQLVQINARVPQLLLPMLAERGFACEVDDSDAEVRVRIWRAGGD
jgi:uncharacterized protein (DUF2249 family)